VNVIFLFGQTSLSEYAREEYQRTLFHVLALSLFI
jgi:hypothetical protein